MLILTTETGFFSFRVSSFTCHCQSIPLKKGLARFLLFQSKPAFFWSLCDFVDVLTYCCELLSLTGSVVHPLTISSRGNHTFRCWRGKALPVPQDGQSFICISISIFVAIPRRLVLLHCWIYSVVCKHRLTRRLVLLHRWIYSVVCKHCLTRTLVLLHCSVVIAITVSIPRTLVLPRCWIVCSVQALLDMRSWT